jgi:hypothetical protein
MGVEALSLSKHAKLRLKFRRSFVNSHPAHPISSRCKAIKQTRAGSSPSRDSYWRRFKNDPSQILKIILLMPPAYYKFCVGGERNGDGDFIAVGEPVMTVSVSFQKLLSSFCPAFSFPPRTSLSTIQVTIQVAFKTKRLGVVQSDSGSTIWTR